MMDVDVISLYAKDSTGAMRVWSISASEFQIQIEYGTLGGEMVCSTEDINEGKASRSLEEQLLSRINSRVNKKLDSGYVYDIEDANNNKRVNLLGREKPMLAQRYDKMKDTSWIEGALYQRKYNGHRCLITKVDGDVFAYSRNGKIIDSIHEILNCLSDIEEGTTLDGELYIHGVSLQKISSFVKKRQDRTSELKFICYDIISDESYSKRHELICEIVKPWMLDGIIIACTFNFHRSIATMLKEVIDSGYEGLIARVDGYSYEPGKRSKGLVKIKKMLDDEFLVVDITRSVDGWGVLKCTMPDGKTFHASAPGNVREKALAYLERAEYIGRKVNVEYAELTDGGIPFHPVAIGWREKESE